MAIDVNDFLYFMNIKYFLQVQEQPKDLNFSEIVVDIDFHPGKDVIAAGTIEGQVSL